ncbi:MAG: TetR/AcrR family transcriptional regulator [Clostridia bacterium]|nr:TetR/AcrR family transcriptional regulator [Clostridia bacterium]
MARAQKNNLTRLQIIKVATKLFLEKGYSSTTAKMICNELGISTGNLTFYFPSKEHLLAEMTDMFCGFQWEITKQETSEGESYITAICLELVTMAALCETDPVSGDFYLSTYTSPMCLNIIRRNDSKRAQIVFKDYQPNWTSEDFDVAEIVVSGIEYGLLMKPEGSVSLTDRIYAALKSILFLYGVGKDEAHAIIDHILEMNYNDLGKRFMEGFKEFVNKSNEQALLDLLQI